MYQHHIMLKTHEQLDSEGAMDWLGITKRFGPENIVFLYQHGAHEVAMEYGVNECDKFPHVYTIPLTRDLASEEAAIIVAAWDYKYVPDFNIEISNMYSMASDYEIDIDESLVETATIDLNNSTPIKISAAKAIYNSINYDTKFYENVLVTYDEHIIKSDNLDLDFEKSLATVSNNIIYKNLNTKLQADKVVIDLITKNSRIFMNNKLDKVNIVKIN